MSASVKITCENFDYFVKPEFLEKVDLKKTSNIDLWKEHNLMNFLHNENGPAIINLDNGETNFVVNGTPATDEQIEKIKHNDHFSKSVKETIIDKK